MEICWYCSINIVRKGSLWSKDSFWERGNFSLKQDFRSEAFYYASESTQSNNATRVFFYYSLATWMTNWFQIFTGLLFYAYVGIHQVRRLIFDKYGSSFWQILALYIKTILLFLPDMTIQSEWSHQQQRSANIETRISPGISCGLDYGSEHHP